MIIENVTKLIKRYLFPIRNRFQCLPKLIFKHLHITKWILIFFPNAKWEKLAAEKNTLNGYRT